MSHSTIPIQPAPEAGVGAPRDIQHYLRPGLLQLSSLPPLSLYVHIPWCLRKCPYCDFNSHQAPAQLPEQDYVAALLADLEAALPLIWGRQVHSIFIGGGTPSLFAPQTIDQLLGAIRARLPLEAGCEITQEPRGSGGFGFDPVMFIPEFGKTFAELPTEVKNAHSHRGRAALQMLALMRERWF